MLLRDVVVKSWISKYIPADHHKKWDINIDFISLLKAAEDKHTATKYNSNTPTK